MPSSGLKAAASWAKRPACMIGCRLDCPPAGTSKMKPWGCVSRAFWMYVSAVPVAREVAGEVVEHVGAVDRLLARDPRAPRHAAAGAVHLRAVEARERVEHLAERRDQSWSSCRRVPTSRTASPGPNAPLAAVLLSSWLRTSHTLPSGPANDGHAVVTAGEHACRRSSTTGGPSVSWNER